jgi:hypothetical protein
MPDAGRLRLDGYCRSAKAQKDLHTAAQVSANIEAQVARLNELRIHAAHMLLLFRVLVFSLLSGAAQTPDRLVEVGEFQS